MVKIKLRNFIDMQNAKTGIIAPEAIRETELEALVDTGATSLAIPHEVAELLGAPTVDYQFVQIADGSRLRVPYVGGLWIELLGRATGCNAIVLPRGMKRTLLGAVQLEELDLVVVPKTGEVITNPAHPDGATLSLYNAA